MNEPDEGELFALRDLNRDEWVDKPFVIVLRGGINDGVRFRWHELPAVWREPERPAIGFDIGEPCMSLRAAGPTIADYRWARSVTDDGAHVYEFVGYE